jgi:hypothetical protein
MTPVLDTSGVPKLILVGGITSKGGSDQIWEYSGGATPWRPTLSAVTPKNTTLSTGTVDNGTWTKLPIARLASARNGASITFDPWRRQLVMFGGYDASFTMHADVTRKSISPCSERLITK